MLLKESTRLNKEGPLFKKMWTCLYTMKTFNNGILISIITCVVLKIITKFKKSQNKQALALLKDILCLVESDFGFQQLFL